MHARALNVLHYAGNQHVRAVGDHVHLQLHAGHVLVHQHRVVDAAGQNARHVALHVVGLMGDGHVLTADDVAGAQQHRIAQRLGGGERLLQRAHARALGAADGEFLQQLVEALAVLCDVDALGGGAQNGNARAVQRLGQANGRLAAEGHHHAHGLLHVDDAQHVLVGQRLEVEPVGGVVVGGDGLGVVVDDDHVVAELFERPDAVDGGIVELDALADADGAGAEHDDDRLARAGERAGLALRVEGGVEVGRLRVEFRAAGVHHLERGLHLGQRLRAGEPLQRRVGVAELFAGEILRVRQAMGNARLVIRQLLELAQEPAVDLRDLVDVLHGNAALERLEHGEQPMVVHPVEPLFDVYAAVVRTVERVQLDLRAAHGLHQRHFEAVGDGHDLAGGLHLSAQRAARARKLVEGPLGEFDHHVVQRRLKAGAGLARDLVFDLVQRVAQRDLGGDLGDGIAGGLAGQRRRAGHAWVDLDDGVFEAVGIQRELAVAAAHDAQRRDDVQRGTAQHLIFLVREGQRRGDDDGVAGVHAHWVEVLHGAHGDGVARGIAHDLELDFLPARHGALDEHLGDGRHVQTRAGDLAQLLGAGRRAAARAAQREGRAHDDGIADLLRHGQRLSRRRWRCPREWSAHRFRPSRP